MYTFASEERYSDGQVIFREESAGNWVYVIFSGAVELSKQINNKKFILETLKEGDLFGELAFIGKAKRTATATAVGETLVGLIDRDSLDLEYNKLSTDFRMILQSILKKFEKTNARIADLTDRAEPRVKRKLSVSYRDKKSFLNAYTENISNGGIFLKTNSPLPKGTSIFLRLQLPDIPAPLEIDSLVIWSNRQEDGDKTKPSGMGIQFRDMDKKDRKILNDFTG